MSRQSRMYREPFDSLRQSGHASQANRSKACGPSKSGDGAQLPFLLVGDGAQEAGDRRFMGAHERGQIVEARVKRSEWRGEDRRPLRHPRHEFGMTAHARREPSDVAQTTFGIGAVVIVDRNHADKGRDASHAVQHQPPLDRRIGQTRPERIGAFGEGEQADRRLTREDR